MKKYTFKLNNNNTPSFNSTFRTKSTDYSKILDDLILDDIIDKNPWLGKKKEELFIDNLIKESHTYTTFTFDDDFEKATKFLENYNSSIFKPFKKNKTYELTDGTIIMITDDYIHIDDKMIFFNLLGDKSFISTLSPKIKKTICTIYTDGLKITIKA